ncbi:MAG: condensation domain-containing protein, partial [Acidobacteria bacterium]|nr:condensation domain-containing protein [Acidobacteriota bacterium]
LNQAALEQSLNEIVRRHEALRTTFSIVDNQPVQVIAPSLSLSVRMVDLAHLPESEQATKASRLFTEETRQSFDLSRGPLIRTLLLRLSEDKNVLLVTMHHIISDAWTYEVFSRELHALYEAYCEGQPSPLEELPIQYADFAVWQRQWLTGEVLEKQLEYWRQQLAGAPAVLDLPLDKARPPVQSFRGASQSLTLSEELTESLKALSQQEGTTLFMTLLAAFKTLLHRYTSQDDIVVGSSIAGRNRAETEGLIGFFINTLVLRTDMSGNPTFRELLGRVREVALGAYEHQDLPFEKLVEELQPERDMSRNPLFQVTFQLVNVTKSVDDVLESTAESIEDDSDPSDLSLDIERGTAIFDLAFDMYEGDDGLSAEVEYSTDLFEDATITYMLRHFESLLENIVANPSGRIASLPFISTEEQQQVLVEWNDTGASYPQSSSIHEAFEFQVERTPDAVAIISPDAQLTYRELNKRANQLAGYLRKRGVGPEVLVGICLPRSVEMIVGLLGILKAGGAYVPLDPAYPKQRLAMILKDTAAAVLVTEEGMRGELPEHGASVVSIDGDREEIGRESVENVESGVGGENLAYIIYTSGSTGTPKGVMGLHRGALNRFFWMWETYPFEAGEICCQKTSLNFVDSVWEIFGPLLSGVRVAIIPDIVLKDPYRLMQMLAANRVTRIVLVPSLLRVILENEDLQSKLPKLKYWTTSGEALSIDLFDQFQKSMPDAILINLYGSSEVAADATGFDASERKKLANVPIGRPIANTEVYILDENFQPVLWWTGTSSLWGEWISRSRCVGIGSSWER